MEEIYDRAFDMVRKFECENIMMITFEHMTGIEIPQELGRYKLHKTKKFGKSSLSYYY